MRRSPRKSMNCLVPPHVHYSPSNCFLCVMRALCERKYGMYSYVRTRKVASMTTMNGSGAFSPAWKPPKRDAITMITTTTTMTTDVLGNSATTLISGARVIGVKHSVHLRRDVRLPSRRINHWGIQPVESRFWIRSSSSGEPSPRNVNAPRGSIASRDCRRAERTSRRTIFSFTDFYVYF